MNDKPKKTDKLPSKTKTAKKPNLHSSDNILSEINHVAKKSVKSHKFSFSRRLKITFMGLATLILMLLIGTLATVVPLLQIKKLVALSQVDAQNIVTAIKAQNIPEAKSHLENTQSNLNQIKRQYSFLSWHRFSPFRIYYLDGLHLLNAATLTLDSGETGLKSIEPYADVLGFAGEGTFTGGTIEDRIVKIIETIDEIAPNVDQIATNLDQVNQELLQIDPERYPFEVQGHNLADLISMGQDYSSLARQNLTQIRPLLDVLPDVAGLNEPKKYLVLFQNDAEIRPTGGFMTAYGIITIDKGRVGQEKSDDIYELDQKFNSRLKPPEPIKKYLDNVFYWNLRDMNLSPDYKVSMETFHQYYREIKNEPQDIDGIIAVDTQVLTKLVSILGPIDLPGFGTFSADIDKRCDCPQVIYQLEDISTRPVAYVRDDRKAFLGPMMHTMILKAYGAPKETWPHLFKTVYESIQQKHVLFYLFDENSQKAAETAGFAGRLESSPGDYLHINDTNFGGAKSNLFITEEIESEIKVKDNKTYHNLTITYKNPAPASNCNLEAGQLCLNGIYRDYVRFYLPQESTLTESLGFVEDSVKTYEELDKTVVEGFFTSPPQSQAKLKLSYSVPYNPTDEYQLKIQKQPGKQAPKYTLIFNGVDKQEFELTTDKLIKFEL